MKNNNKKIAIVHYTYPPVIGGVESVIQNHARILTKNGYRVKIITGEGGKDEKIDVKVIPQLTSLTLVDEYLDRKIKRGILPNRFYQLKDEISSRLRDELKEVDICIIHNIMTMHFNLPLTCALDEIIDKLSNNIRFYLWCHDCALLNPSYTDDIPDRNLYPWNLLSKFNPKVSYIAISEVRKKQLASLFSIDEDLIQVIPVGLEIKSFLNISDPVWNLAWDKGFFESDLVMFFPSRMLKRKNYELGIRVVREMKNRGKICRFVITAPPDPHNPKTNEYFNYLHDLSKKLDVEEEIVFLSDLKEHYGIKMDYNDIKELYSICDVLFLTSTQEGFGIPLLEAGAKRMPVICTNIESLAEIAGDYALRIDFNQDISTITTRILNYVESSSVFSMFKKVISHYSWEMIYNNYFKKLLG